MADTVWLRSKIQDGHKCRIGTARLRDRAGSASVACSWSKSEVILAPLSPRCAFQNPSKPANIMISQHRISQYYLTSSDQAYLLCAIT